MGGLSRHSGGLLRNVGDTSEPLKRGELILAGSLTKSVELGVPVRQKVSWSVILDDPPIFKEHDPIIIDHSP